MIPLSAGPQRAVVVSVIGQTVLGLTFAIIGCIAMMRIMLSSDLDHAARPLAMATILYLAPGIVHLCFAIYIARRRGWAISMAEFLITFYLVVLAFAVAYTMLTVVAHAIGGGSGRAPPLVLPAFLLALLAVLGSMRSMLLQAHKAAGPNVARGFLPVMREGVESTGEEEGGSDGPPAG